MVVVKFFIMILPILLLGCYKNDDVTKNNELVETEVELKMSNEDYDKQYYRSLEKDWLSEKDFLYIAEYVINKAKKK